MQESEPKVGKYTVEIYNHYIAYKIGKYLTDYPNRTYRQARNNARRCWAQKLKAHEQPKTVESV